MNTEELQNKKNQLNDILKYINSTVDSLDYFKEQRDLLTSEIAELEKPKEPQPLSFLQLAQKYDIDVANAIHESYRCKGYTEEEISDGIVYSESVSNAIQVSIRQARKFVAEIYLTLLAKELNGNSVINFRVGSMLKYYIAYSHTNNCPVINDHLINDAGIIYFATKEIAEHALTYSPEAVTMWQWFFGKEEGK